MNRRILQFAFVAVSVIPASPADAQDRVVAYVPNWIDLRAFAETIDYAKLTHINIAFENPVNASGDLSFNDKDRVLTEKAHANKVKVLVSIGGGSASGDKVLKSRYSDLLGEDKRNAFAAKIADYVVTHDFDGLDVDIEGPSINGDYGAFIEAVAPVLKAKGRLLTAALSKGYGGPQVPDSAIGRFDFVNIMAYDGAGYWDPKAPGQHSSFEFAVSNVDYWLKRGLDKSRAVLGVPFYGYGFGEAFKKRDYPYSTIVSGYPGAEKVDQVGNTIWYNGIPTIQRKVEYVVSQGLGGVMIWSLDSDVKGERSLLSAIRGALKKQPAANP